jgi:hypothetical protein
MFPAYTFLRKAQLTGPFLMLLLLYVLLHLAQDKDERFRSLQEDFEVSQGASISNVSFIAEPSSCAESVKSSLRCEHA